MDWLVTNMGKDVKEVIKAKAKGYGCTIPQLLALDYSNTPIPSKDSKGWFIPYIDNSLVDDLKDAAKNRNISVAKYLKLCHNSYQNKVSKKNIKAAMVKAVKEIIDDLEI